MMLVVKKVKRVLDRHDVRFYSYPIFQTAWAPKPQHVNFASALWVDLTIVGMLFRLDEFYLLQSVDNFWIPYAVFLAIFDSWESRLLIQAEYRTKRTSFVHASISVLSWLLLALMGITIPYDLTLNTSNGSNSTFLSWGEYDQSVFSYLKLAHAVLRVISYIDVFFLAKHQKTRHSALPRLFTYSLGLLPLIAAPIISSYPQYSKYANICYFGSFIIQKLVWSLITHFNLMYLKDVMYAKTNMPFIITRYRDWSQLQLGACVLGLITTDIRLSDGYQYAVVITSYFFIASLDLLTYSSDAQVFHLHALIVGKHHSVLWLEAFTVLGLSLLGVAVGIRFTYSNPIIDYLQNIQFIWLLLGSSIIAMISIFVQELTHKSGPFQSKKKTAFFLFGGKKRVGFLKSIIASTSLISLIVNQDSSFPSYLLTLNLAISTSMVLLVQAINGGFRREVAKRSQIRLNGHLLAFIVAKNWLKRARLRIAERKRKEALSESNLHRNSTFSQPQVVKKESNSNFPSLTPNASVMGVSYTTQDSEIIQSAVDHVLEDDAESIWTVEDVQKDVFDEYLSDEEEEDDVEQKQQEIDVKPDGEHIESPALPPIDPLDGTSNPLFLSLSAKLSSHESRVSTVVDDTAIVPEKTPNERSVKFDLPISDASPSFKAKNKQKFLEKRKKRSSVTTSRVLKKVLNENFYEKPRLLAEQDVFAEYTVSWSDLFLDIIYVGVVYRLGKFISLGLITKTGGSITVFYLFATLFYAIFTCWYAKLGFSSKTVISDVFHKFVDILQGLFIMICAMNVTSPDEMRVTPLSFLIICGMLVLFHLTMIFLWFEVYFSKGHVATVACSTRNLRREFACLLMLIIAFIVAGLASSLTEVISIFLALSWLVPTFERFVTRNHIKPNEKAPYLLRYVLHRISDGALILLGEGVFQVLISVGDSKVFIEFTLCFLNVFAARLAIFEMDCFDEHAKKHAVLTSRLAHLCITFVRSFIASPTIIVSGVALKLIVEEADIQTISETITCQEREKYELLCGAFLLMLLSFVSIYHLHRSAYFKSLRKKHFIFGFSLSFCFLIFPWIPCISFIEILSGTLFIWLFATLTHELIDDLFTSHDQTVSDPRAEQDATERKEYLKYVKSSKNALESLKNNSSQKKFFESSSRRLIDRANSVRSVTQGLIEAISPALRLSKRRLVEELTNKVPVENEEYSNIKLPAIRLPEIDPSLRITKHQLGEELHSKVKVIDSENNS